MRNNVKLTFQFRNVIEYLTYSLLFLMLFVPFEYQYLKAILLTTIILSVTTQAVITSKVQTDVRVLFWCLIIIGTGIFFVLWGTLNGYTDSIKLLPVYVIWPIAYIFIMGSVTRIKAINNIFRLFTCTSFLIALYSILYILSALNILPFYTIFSLTEGAKVSIGTEFISYFMPSITSMIYLVPFMLSSLLLWSNNDEMPIKTFWLYIALVISLLAIIFTSRRIFWILLLFTPVLTFAFMLFLKNTHRRIRNKIFFKNIKKICVFILCFIAVVTCFYLTEITEVMVTFLNSDVFVMAATFEDEGTVLRDEQLKNLLAGWSDVPFLGAGHGASLPGYLRSLDAPWMYELSYSALLFQTGLIGLIIYFLEILWIFYMGIKLSRENEKLSLYCIPTLVGMTCFLVANATNPYLQAFDHLWTIFVPLMLINLFLLKPNIGTIA